MESTIERDCRGNLFIDGHVIYSFDIVPNTYEDMRAMIDSNCIKFQLFNIKSPTVRPDETIECTVRNIYKEEAFLLVSGGWIPCALIKNNTIIVADRNIVSEIVSRYTKGQKKNGAPLDALDGIFLQGNHCIDITAFVIEGNKQKIPENNEIDEQITNITRSLRLALPNLNIANYPNGKNYYYAFRDLLSGDVRKRMMFLQDVAPKLNKQFTEKSRKLAVRHVFSSAERFDLNKNDLSIVLALLRIVMAGKKTAAQLVLKDSQIYTEKDSYNTACDLTAVEILTNLHNFHVKKNTGYNVAFITKDKGLSLFNALFTNPEVISSDGVRLMVTARIDPLIFGGDHEIWQEYENWFAGKV